MLTKIHTNILSNLLDYDTPEKLSELCNMFGYSNSDLLCSNQSDNSSEHYIRLRGGRVMLMETALKMALSDLSAERDDSLLDVEDSPLSEAISFFWSLCESSLFYMYGMGTHIAFSPEIDDDFIDKFIEMFDVINPNIYDEKQSNCISNIFNDEACRDYFTAKEL